MGTKRIPCLVLQTCDATVLEQRLAYRAQRRGTPDLKWFVAGVGAVVYYHRVDVVGIAGLGRDLRLSFLALHPFAFQPVAELVSGMRVHAGCQPLRNLNDGNVAIHARTPREILNLEEYFLPPQKANVKRHIY